MRNVYRASSARGVVQTEGELSAQLAALRAEIEESGLPPGGPASRRYSSVPPPRDVSYFRAEREQTLRRGLQVAEPCVVQSQAGVMQEELQSCLDVEYGPRSLPLLLHQFHTDRSYHLAQIKYQLMLRWRRFCRHSGVLESLYPHYKDQVVYLISEFEDAVQRARRLAACREKVLAGGGGPVDTATREDVALYLRWLTCHLHSVKTVHNLLHVLHYIPVCERKEIQPFMGDEDQHASGPADGVPMHTVEVAEFLPGLRSLVALFHLPCDPANIRSTADEMELFSTVWREFRSVFAGQELRRTFPRCDGTEVRGSQWGRRDEGLALRKDSGWIPFIQVKPRRDPWQQRLLTELKEEDCADELLKMHCRFLQVSDVVRVGEALKERATRVCDSAKQSSDGGEPETSGIWTSVYRATSLSQEIHDHPSNHEGRESQNKHKTSSAQNESYTDSLQLLALQENKGRSSSDPIATRGAYLSLIHLRHLRIRELQRIALGLLNYLRSVERTLTFDLAGLRPEEGSLSSTGEERGWMNVAGGGRGLTGGLGSVHHAHDTPVDYKIHCSEFMQFPEVENLHDFYSAEGRLVRVQDQRGLYIVYDSALKDLEDLENTLVLIGSHYVRRKLIGSGGSLGPAADVGSRGGAGVDRVAVLLDLWTCETEFLESKVQLLNCYYEAYQHVSGLEERFAMAQVITDVMHRRPQLDLSLDYFVQAYRADVACLRSHQHLIRAVLNHQIDKQRQYLHRIWRGGHVGTSHTFGFPPNCVPKNPVSLGGSSSELKSVFLLELHPSLCLASLVYQGLVHAHTELCQLHGARRAAERVSLEQKLLQRALQSWNTLAAPGASYGPQVQKDLFSDVFFEDPVLVQGMALSLISSAEESDVKQGKEKQRHAVETLSKLLELVTLRHRLTEAASETAHLAELYRNLASELGFDEFHLYLRPVQFEFAAHKDTAEQGSARVTALLQDSSCVERFSPSSLPLSVQELDENQIGRFSFHSEETSVHLVNRQSIENLQVALACQVTQKNGLISALKQASLCYWAERASASPQDGPPSDAHPKITEPKLDTGPQSLQPRDLPPKVPRKTVSGPKGRLRESFVSIQLEKVHLRDEMLNSFVRKKQALGGFIKDPEEAAKIKRKLILDFCKKFTARVSQYCVRGQIVAYYYGLISLLDDVPAVRQSHFVIGQINEIKPSVESKADPRTFQPRPRSLLSEDGKKLLNLWYIPHFSEVLHMFESNGISACAEALHHTLHVAAALHDVVHYLVSFAKLGSTEVSRRPGGKQDEAAGLRLAAEWGASQGIGAELLELQRQVDALADPTSPEAVGQMLQLRRQLLFLQFDTAVRHLIREVFLSSADVPSLRSVSDNMAAALPLLCDPLGTDMHAALLPVPQPLEARSTKLCLSGLGHRSRLQANAAVLGVSLLLEDVLSSTREADVEPFHLHDDKDGPPDHGKSNPEEPSCPEAEQERVPVPPLPVRDPIQVLSVQRGFLLLTKQLQVFKDNWALRRLGADLTSVPSLYTQFVKLYRAEIFDPSMRSLAEHMGKQREYEALVSAQQSLLPPPGASEVDVSAWQLRRLLECTERDMIRVLQSRINHQLTLVMAERTRRDAGLPTELWRKAPLRYSLSPERPAMVESFIQQLMEATEESDGQVRLSGDHLRLCLDNLGCQVMDRERRNFLFYSQFYEQILQQDFELLRQKEQDIKKFEDPQFQTSNYYNEVAAQCRGMMLRISGLQARAAQLEEEKEELEERLSLKHKQHYHALVHQLFSTCIQMKGRLDEYHVHMEQDVSQIVSKVRGEGVDKIIKLKKKYGSGSAGAVSQVRDDLCLKNDVIRDLHLENIRLAGLLRKIKVLSKWKQVVKQGKLHRELLQSQQREMTFRREALGVQMSSEHQVVVLQEELDATRTALLQSQTECGRTRKLLNRKAEELQAARQRSAQEARSRQELDGHRAQSLERMRSDLEERDRRLRALGEQLHRGSRESQMERQRSAKEIRQARSQLHQERSLKQEAFQQVDKLQTRVNSIETALSRCTSTPVQSKTHTPSFSRLGVISAASGLGRSSNQSAVQLGRIGDGAPGGSVTESAHRKAEPAWSRSRTSPDRPRADALNADVMLPDLFDGRHSSLPPGPRISK